MSGSAIENAVSDENAGVGERIRRAREAAGMSVPQLARRLGVEASSVKAWEDGDRDPRANRLRNLSGLLGVSLAWVLDGGERGAPGPASLTANLLRQRVQRARTLLAETASILDEIDTSLASLDRNTDLVAVAGDDDPSR